MTLQWAGGIDQEGLIDVTHPSLPAITNRLRQQANTTAFWNEEWTVAVADLSRVCSLQQAVAAQQATDRVSGIDPDNLVSIAEVTLPPPSEAQLPVQLDEYRHTWTVTAANPNLQFAGHFANQVQPGFWAFGFIAAIAPSFLQVARHHGRYVLRDGYHRAYGLLARGITHAPAFVRDYGVSELGTKPELFGTDVYLGQHPPRLSDFLDDDVAADVEVPAVQKMVVVQGIELTPPA